MPVQLLSDAAAKKSPRWTAPASFLRRSAFRSFLLYTGGLVLFCSRLSPAAALVVTENDFVSGPDGRECVCDGEYDAAVDYFPTKVAPDVSEGWNVTYHGSYKVIHNLVEGEAYVAYLCGTPAPALEGALENATLVSIPIRTVGVLPTVAIPFVEYLGQRQSIKVTANANIESHCVAKLTAASAIVDVYDSSSWGPDHARLESMSLDVVLCDAWSCPKVRSLTNHTAITLSQQTESTLLGDVEWVEFMSLFYNREAAAKNVVANIGARFECERAAVTAAVTAKPKVLWARWAGNGWDLGNCPGAWYCAIVDAAGGELVGQAEYGPSASGLSWGYYSTEEFIAGPGKTADVLIYTGANLLEPDAYFTPAAMQDANASAAIAELAAYQGGRVFDILGNGMFDWFESRQAEPDVLLLDMIAAFHPQMQVDHERVWLRKVVGEVEPAGVGGNASQCTDVAASLFTKWTSLGCAGEGEPIVIPGLMLPGIADFGAEAAGCFTNADGTIAEKPASVAAPIAAPIAAPVAAPVATPVAAPVAAPVTAPVTAPVAAPVAAAPVAATDSELSDAPAMSTALLSCVAAVGAAALALL